MEERNEILVAEDEEEIRRQVVCVVKEIFPDLNLHECSDTVSALRVIHNFGEKLLLVISDGMMDGNTNAGVLVTHRAKEKGVKYLALYSTSAKTLERKLQPNVIKCIEKPKIEEVTEWLGNVRAQTKK